MAGVHFPTEQEIFPFATTHRLVTAGVTHHRVQGIPPALLPFVNHYGRQTVKMDSRICNYFIFPLYLKQWTSVTLTEDYCSHLTMQIQLDVPAGRTAVHVNTNATTAPDRKTSTRKHLLGMYQKQEYLQT